MTGNQNKLANLLSICGILFILFGVVSSFVFFGDEELTATIPGLPTAMGWSALASGLVSGILFFGFAEVIKLLQGIYDRSLAGTTLKNDSSSITDDGLNVMEFNSSGIDPEDEHEIRIYFAERNQTIHSITPTNQVGVYIVDVNGEKKKVEAGGFAVKVLH
ncbi:hypothetical protein [Halobacillus mangrovi]|uniref:Uncharacterized protein n=1 Tax=Halobacillus mangrovi TaxID=402384 RepID=A0A1W5ZSX4_9BACI|nr:hypothetical protein [Halobacillus mangrovi]ARI76379.1 hypothetical protein HM131_05805 [Halobacillus mangrovi]